MENPLQRFTSRPPQAQAQYGCFEPVYLKSDLSDRGIPRGSRGLVAAALDADTYQVVFPRHEGGKEKILEVLKNDLVPCRPKVKRGASLSTTLPAIREELPPMPEDDAIYLEGIDPVTAN